MNERPEIGAQVRVRHTTGIPNVGGRIGSVIAHHEDGVAIVVDLRLVAGHSLRAADSRITCDPSDVERVFNVDHQPVRIIGSAT